MHNPFSVLKLLLISSALLATTLPASSHANLYSFTNADGEYVVSQKPPADKNIQYAVLSDDGEFLRMVPGRRQNVPITHWRPWFIPEEPEPWEGNPYPDMPREREPVVSVDEVSAERADDAPPEKEENRDE
jgi:hypothetical protein